MKKLFFILILATLAFTCEPLPTDKVQFKTDSTYSATRQDGKEYACLSVNGWDVTAIGESLPLLLGSMTKIDYALSRNGLTIFLTTIDDVTKSARVSYKYSENVLPLTEKPTAEFIRIGRIYMAYCKANPTDEICNE